MLFEVHVTKLTECLDIIDEERKELITIYENLEFIKEFLSLKGISIIESNDILNHLKDLIEFELHNSVERKKFLNNVIAKTISANIYADDLLEVAKKIVQ